MFEKARGNFLSSVHFSAQIADFSFEVYALPRNQNYESQYNTTVGLA
jgi:hypothetical protein